MASVAYDAAKKAARLMKAKQAHDELISAAFRAQADALSIEAQAKRRLADEYDAAQERGELATGRDGPGAGVLNGNAKATASDVGLSRKGIHEARELRDAEAAEPGIVRRTVDDAIASGEEPTKAKVRRAVKEVIQKAEPNSKQQAKSQPQPSPPASKAIADRQLDALTKEVADLRAKMIADLRAQIEALEAGGQCSQAKAEPQIDPATTLSMSAQQKLEATIRQHKRKADAEHAARLHGVDEEVRLRVVAEGKDYLAMLEEKQAKAQASEKLWREMINGHKPPFTIDQFKTILMCLHPDGERTADKLAQAFRLFNGKRVQLTGKCD
jgi:hypothetical protein